ncbi:MAG: FIST C-terminal domain-containing protein [Elusimicrobia bacterium]|nr:FIST C-terminal domain-containing protein [Elusimicrobiota bacterium]
MNAPASKGFSAALSTDRDWRRAVRTVAAKARKDLGEGCDLALVFVSEIYAGLEPEQLCAELGEALPSRLLLGCNSSGVIMGSREVELEPAVSLMAMRLPGVAVRPLRFSSEQSHAAEGGPRLLENLDVYPSDAPKFILLADPMGCDVERLVKALNESYPGSPMVGGLASGLAVGRPNWLVLDGQVCRQGAVGAALCGDVELDIAVAQGCRPIGSPLIITKAQAHILLELGGRPAVEVLKELLGSLPVRDQALARHSLFGGLVMNEYRDRFGRGDFLVRNIIGYDAQSGALMIGTQLRPGQTFQFQLRDAETSSDDLRALLGRIGKVDRGEKGALLFSCCGRGRGLYGKPDHDSGLVQKMHGPLALAGFFANGEIGPVGERNYIHGYTSSLAILR